LAELDADAGAGLKALGLNCTLKKSPERSHTEALMGRVFSLLSEHGVETELLRPVDYPIAFGVSSDEGDGDEWPQILDKIKAADIMPRHLHRTGEFPTPMTVPPGATLADTRRQLVLRAFASTNGDYARTATIVGMTPADVRAEIASLLNGRPSETSTPATNGARVARPAELPPAAKGSKAPVKASSAAAAKSKSKKR